MDSNPLINLGELTKPATVLVEKISDAVGGIFKPYQLRRIAQAEADVALIHARNEIEITELHRRGLLRWVEEIAEEQFNIEEVTRQALPLIGEDASPQSMDNDWIKNFFSKCRTISNGEMQSLWARILAGEANVPGSFSRQTINLLENISSLEAELFSRLCRFTWDFKGHADSVILCPAIFKLYEIDPMYTEHGIDFGSLQRLVELGLIQTNITGYEVQYSHDNPEGRNALVLASYHGRQMSLRIKDFITRPILHAGSVAFTNSGAELSHVSKWESIDGFYEFVQGFWDGQGYIDKIFTSSDDADYGDDQYLEALEIRASPGMRSSR